MEFIIGMCCGVLLTRFCVFIDKMVVEYKKFKEKDIHE